MELCLAEMDANKRLVSCNRAIESGSWTGSDLAMIYAFRGNAYAHLKDYGKAIRDYTEQIQRDPDSAYGLTSRGAAFAIMGDFERARADYNAMIKNYEKSGNAGVKTGGLRGLAWIEFIKGNFPGASKLVADYFRISEKGDGEDLILLRYIASRRAGQPMTKDQFRLEIFKHMTLIDKGKFSDAGWMETMPIDFVRLYAGALSEEKFLAFWPNASEHDQFNACFWNFYYGEYKLLQGDKQRARGLLQSAADGCGGDVLELPAAQAEVNRLN